ncbi:MAG: nickel pincer cofactor biosynthesis protein LarC [Pseudomonadota bacterium]
MIAYIDCFSGISGDMTLGAMIGLGVPADWLSASVADMPLTGFRLETGTVVRGGVRGNQVRVVVAEGQPHRDYRSIRDLIENSALKPSVKSLAGDIFHRLAEAEAAVHGCPVDHVHFHEVGSVDAIVDIVGTALAMDHLGVVTVMSNVPTVGFGTVVCSHGRLPVPAPATAEMLKGVPVRSGTAEGERVTPTGAAILTTLSQGYGPMPDMVVERIGYGAGEREFADMPNLLRIVLGRETGDTVSPGTETAVMVESCIDDMNPEIFGYVMERLFEDGALDVFWVPVFMKKNRPGTMVSVLCTSSGKDAIIRRLLTETTTIGVRCHDVVRHVLARRSVTVDTDFGPAPVKEVVAIDGSLRRIPEYEFCRQIARARQIPIRIVYETITANLLKH